MIDILESIRNNSLFVIQDMLDDGVPASEAFKMAMTVEDCADILINAFDLKAETEEECAAVATKLINVIGELEKPFRFLFTAEVKGDTVDEVLAFVLGKLGADEDLIRLLCGKEDDDE